MSHTWVALAGDELDTVLCRLIGEEPWTTRAPWLDQHAECLLSEALDGRLAVLHVLCRTDRSLQIRVEWLRLLLEDARFDGHVGLPAPLSTWFAPAYVADGVLTGPAILPPPPPDLARVPIEQVRVLYTGAALLRAWSWTGRRRILSAFPELVTSGTLATVLRGAAQQAADEHQRLFSELVKATEAAPADGLATACARAPEIGPMNAGVARHQPLMTPDEALQFMLLAFVETPTWHRRRAWLRMVDSLLDDRSLRLLDVFQAGKDADHPWVAAIASARVSLLTARRHGIDAATDPDRMPPTQVRLAGNVTEAQLEALPIPNRATWTRQHVHFLDPDLAPLRWSEANLALTELLTTPHSSRHPALDAEEALMRAQHALTVVDREVDTAGWRRLQSALGRVHRQRLRGDRARAGDARIDALEAIAATYSDATPAARAPALVDLAEAYAHRIAGARSDNLRRAVSLFRRALATMDREADPVAYAHAQVAIASASMQDTFGDLSERLEIARAHTDEALADPRLAERDPRLWATAHYVRAGVFVRRRGPVPDNDLAAAVRHFGHALEIFTRETDLRRWAQCQEGLGAAHVRLNPGADGRSRASAHYRNALAAYPAEHAPQARRHVLVNLGGAHFAGRQWSDAALAYGEAIDLSAQLAEAAETDDARLADISEMTRVHERMAWCRLRLGDIEGALEVLELGKAQRLRLVLAADGFTGERVTTAERLAALVPPEGAVVLPVITSEGAMAFVLDQRACFDLANAQVALAEDTYTRLAAMVEGADHRGGWLGAYAAWLQDDTPASPGAEPGTATRWADAIEAGGGRLWDVLVGPIHARLASLGLREGAPVVFVPSAVHSLLPLAAAWTASGGRRRYLADDFAVATTPSLTALASARGRPVPDPADISVLAVVDPSGDLTHAGEERRALQLHVAARLKLLEPAHASPLEFARAAPGHTHLHLSCHGWFDWHEPASSGLVLADGQILSAREVATQLDLSSVRLVVLSACETGLEDTGAHEYEYVGLGGAFLLAGARAVVGSLWAVDDESTAILMGAFYRHHLGGAEPATALRAAQHELRTRSRFDHPFFWAGFQVMGS